MMGECVFGIFIASFFYVYLIRCYVLAYHILDHIVIRTARWKSVKWFNFDSDFCWFDVCAQGCQKLWITQTRSWCLKTFFVHERILKQTQRTLALWQDELVFWRWRPPQFCMYTIYINISYLYIYIDNIYIYIHMVFSKHMRFIYYQMIRIYIYIFFFVYIIYIYIHIYIYI